MKSTCSLFLGLCPDAVPLLPVTLHAAVIRAAATAIASMCNSREAREECGLSGCLEALVKVVHEAAHGSAEEKCCAEVLTALGMSVRGEELIQTEVGVLGAVESLCIMLDKRHQVSVFIELNLVLGALMTYF